MNERWSEIVGYEGRYSISDRGRIKCHSIRLYNGFGYFIRKEKITIGSLDKDGYLCFKLSVNNKKKCVKIHRLVAEYYVLNNFFLKTVNHLDFDKTNNSYTNLEWSSQENNHKHATENGRMSHNGKNLVVSAKLRQRAVVKILGNKKVEYESLTQASKNNNVSIGNLWACLNGRAKSCGGYKWEYKTNPIHEQTPKAECNF